MSVKLHGKATYFNTEGEQRIEIEVDKKTAEILVSYLVQDVYNAALERQYSDVVRNAEYISDINKAIAEWKGEDNE